MPNSWSISSKSLACLRNTKHEWWGGAAPSILRKALQSVLDLGSQLGLGHLSLKMSAPPAWLVKKREAFEAVLCQMLNCAKAKWLQ